MTNNIILTGKMGSGKTAVAKALAATTGFPVLSFATSVKEITHNLLKAKTVAQSVKIILPYLSPKLKEKFLLERNIPYMVSFLEDLSLYPVEVPKPRKLYQYVGNSLRVLLDEDIWIDYLREEASKHKNFIVDDCRYPNEAVLKKEFKNTYIVKLEVEEETRVRRMKKLYPSFDVSWLKHESEDSVDDITYDSMIVNEDSVPIARTVEAILENTFK